MKHNENTNKKKVVQNRTEDQLRYANELALKELIDLLHKKITKVLQNRTEDQLRYANELARNSRWIWETIKATKALFKPSCEEKEIKK